MYVLVEKIPSACGVIMISRDGMEPSDLVYCAVN